MYLELLIQIMYCTACLRHLISRFLALSVLSYIRVGIKFTKKWSLSRYVLDQYVESVTCQQSMTCSKFVLFVVFSNSKEAGVSTCGWWPYDVLERYGWYYLSYRIICLLTSLNRRFTKTATYKNTIFSNQKVGTKKNNITIEKSMYFKN